MKKNTFFEFLDILSDKMKGYFSKRNNISPLVFFKPDSFHFSPKLQNKHSANQYLNIGVLKSTWYERMLPSFKNIAMKTLLFLLFFSTQLFAQFANVNPPTGGLAIDGGLRANTPTSPSPFTANQGDWYPGSNGTGGSVFDISGNPIAPATSQTSGRVDSEEPYGSNDDIFTNGSKFNDYVSALKWFTNSAPDKNDIDNALYHVSRDPSNNQWIFISGDRLSTNGTSYIDFELLQGTIVQNTNGTFTGTPLASKQNGGGRTKDDIIISMEYTNGGSKPNVYIYQWELTGNTWSYQLVTLPQLATNAFAETNRQGAETNVPYSVFGTNTYQQYAFVEAAVNVTYLINQTLGGSSCSGLKIKTLWVKTKASAASTAALKDFITPIPVDLNFGTTDITPISAKCADDGTAYLLSATPSGGTFSGSGVSGTGPYYFTPSNAGGAGTKTITYTSADGSCTGTINIVVNPLPTAVATNNGPVCSSTTSFTLNETGGNATSWSWTSNGSATITSTNSHSPTVTGFVNNEKFTVTITDINACSSSAETTITVNSNPSAPNVTYNAPACDENTFSITLSSVVSGATYIVKDKNEAEITTLTKNGNPLVSSSYTATSQDATNGITFNGFPAGSGYWVTVQNNGCYSDANTCGTSSSEKMTQSIAPKEELATQKAEEVGFTAYPIPFKDQLTLRYNFDYSSEVLIEVFNVHGLLVLSKKDSNSYLNKEITLNLNSNTTKEQVYIVKLTTNRGSSTQKIISSR
ncbi:T9SS type A sorting domain-containing protein [Flavobacterium taihuense]|uniref:T9SS type A sorting domain-containing protein n=1 Tax=Flavobacterium taihuense TaxID=2857508 RepID=A0ABS6XTN1_9FLAO|nr:T9SS type A sorting domain-containing protein [Flavobacterium taihuense]MBW4360006.1 T9SS type A sorting domain-containing protein [Flavobacterium taihuense]